MPMSQESLASILGEPVAIKQAPRGGMVSSDLISVFCRIWVGVPLDIIGCD